tara:strand:+ start:585 stop:773 length:189 start_codon:yes stop_codon:yes gene_type:complete
MKLIHKQMLINSQTFVPQLRMTIELDMELAEDNIAYGHKTPEEQALEFGKQLMEFAHSDYSK